MLGAGTGDDPRLDASSARGVVPGRKHTRVAPIAHALRRENVGHPGSETTIRHDRQPLCHRLVMQRLLLLHDFGITPEVGVVGAEELAHRTQDPGTALAQHGSGLGALEARVQRNQHGPGRLQADGGEDPLVEVRRPDRDAVAACHTAREQRPRSGQHPALELFEREPRVAVLHGAGPGEALGGRAGVREPCMCYT